MLYNMSMKKNSKEHWIPIGESTLVCEMANKWQDETLLPMIIWIDETKSYVRGHHSKRVKFQLNTSDNLNIDNLGSMDLNGVVQEPTEKRKLRRLGNKNLEQLRNFILNNKYALENIADMKIHLGQIWNYMIMGGAAATEDKIEELNAKVDEIIDRRKKSK